MTLKKKQLKSIDRQASAPEDGELVAQMIGCANMIMLIGRLLGAAGSDSIIQFGNFTLIQNDQFITPPEIRSIKITEPQK